MDRKGSWSALLGFVLTASIALSGCGGGGGGGGTTPAAEPTSGGTGASLQLAEKISVVDASSAGGGAAPLRIGKFRVRPSVFGTATTAWDTDKTIIYVHERSAESFGIINEILCMIDQSQYDEMVNKGFYRAQIDMNQCSQERDSAESAGQESQNQSSGSTMPDYEDWTVNSYRADNNAGTPHTVRVWIHEKAKQDGDHIEPAKTIQVRTTITEGKSDTNPYGIFTLNFKAVNPTSGAVMFKGYLRSYRNAENKVLLEFIAKGGTNGEKFLEQVALNRAADGATGSGTTFNSYSSPMHSGREKFNFAFDQNNFKRQDAFSNASTCLDRDSFNQTAWRYGLYNSSGDRVTRNSGFPIKYNGYHGWVGYWGLWLPDEATINDGATVYRQEYSSNGPPTEMPYTLVKKGGKLKKHTRSLLSLNSVKNIPLDYWQQTCTNQQDPSTCTQTGYRVKWNGTAFVIFQQMNITTNMWENTPSETPINLSTLGWGELNFWSQSLGGQVRVKLIVSGTWPDVTYNYPDPSLQSVIFYKEDVVYPGDTIAAGLRCYENCPQYDATSGVISSGWGANPNDPVAYDYTFSDMLLKDSSNRSLILASATGDNQWGSMSGPIFEPSTSNLALLDCNWDGDNDPSTNPQTCGWKAWSELSEFYSWETGPNQWNQFTALQGPNPATTIVEFDQPLQVAFTYPATTNGVNPTAVDTKYAGTTFNFEYSGFGELHGIPGTCVDMETGQPVSCGPNTRWIAEFMIPEGAEVINGTASYYVKPLEVEQRMEKVEASNCSALTLTPYSLPVMENGVWQEPDIGTEPTTAPPLISEAPAVIGGVVQSGF